MPPIARSRRLRNLLPWVGIAFGAELLAGALYGWIQFVRGGSLHLGQGFPDFLLSYSTGRLEAQFGFTHLYDAEHLLAIERQVTGGTAQQALPLTSPPYVAVLWRPLAALDFKTAYVLWAASMAVLLGVGILLLVRAGGARGRSAWAIGLLGAAWLPTLVAVLQGQVSGLVLVGAAGAAAWWARDERGWRSGLSAALTLARPHLVVLLPVLYAIRGSWRNLAAMVAAGAAVTLATLPLVGIDSWVAYVRVLLPGVEHGNVGFANAQQAPFGLRGIVETAAGASAADVALPLALLVAVGVLVAVRPSTPLLDVGLVTVASLDASLHQNLHDLTLLLVGMLPAAAALMRGEARHRRLGWTAIGLCYLLVDLALFNQLAAAIGIQLLLAYLITERFANTA